MYKTILKPIWTMEYNSGIRLPVPTANLEPFQLKALHMIVDAPWYVPNMVIKRNLQTPTVKDIHCYSSQYSARLSTYINGLSTEHHGTTRQQQAIMKTSAK
jgi:hypothetical protein